MWIRPTNEGLITPGGTTRHLRWRSCVRYEGVQHTPTDCHYGYMSIGWHVPTKRTRLPLACSSAVCGPRGAVCMDLTNEKLGRTLQWLAPPATSRLRTAQNRRASCLRCLRLSWTRPPHHPGRSALGLLLFLRCQWLHNPDSRSQTSHHDVCRAKQLRRTGVARGATLGGVWMPSPASPMSKADSIGMICVRRV